MASGQRICVWKAMIDDLLTCALAGLVLSMSCTSCTEAFDRLIQVCRQRSSQRGCVNSVRCSIHHVHVIANMSF